MKYIIIVLSPLLYRIFTLFRKPNIKIECDLHTIKQLREISGTDQTAEEQQGCQTLNIYHTVLLSVQIE